MAVYPADHCDGYGDGRIVIVVALLFLSVVVAGMAALVASVMTGVIAVGNLWLLLPLAFYAVAFWVLAQLAKDL